MSEFIDHLRSRRSIRLFQDKPVRAEDIAILEEALLRAPSSRGRNPWQFVRVDDHSLLQKLAMAKMSGSTFLAETAVAYVICADESVSDVWIEDCAIASITLQYTAHALGLGSCWAQIRLREHNESQSSERYLQTLLGMPDNVRVASIIGIGYPAESKAGHLIDQLPTGKFHQNEYGTGE